MIQTPLDGNREYSKSSRSLWCRLDEDLNERNTRNALTRVHTVANVLLSSDGLEYVCVPSVAAGTNLWQVW